MDFNSYIYSKAAAARLTDREPKDIESLHKKCDQVLIRFNDGGKPIAINCSEFKEHFAEYRRQQGFKIDDVKPVNSYTYRVKSKYLVAVFPDRVSCTCGDYETQQELGIKRGCCKHGYAVLKTLGCSSLAEFIEKQNSPAPTKVQGESTVESNSNNYDNVWLLVWESYAQEEQDGHPVPVDVIEQELDFKPSQFSLEKLRKNAHSKGYKLACVSEQKRYHHDEF